MLAPRSQSWSLFFVLNSIKSHIHLKIARTDSIHFSFSSIKLICPEFSKTIRFIPFTSAHSTPFSKGMKLSSLPIKLYLGTCKALSISFIRIIVINLLCDSYVIEHPCEPKQRLTINILKNNSI